MRNFHDSSATYRRSQKIDTTAYGLREDVGGHGRQLVLLVLISLRIGRHAKHKYNALLAFSALPHALFGCTHGIHFSEHGVCALRM